MSKQLNALLKRVREDDNTGDVRVMAINDALGLVPGNTIAMRADCVATWLTVPLAIRCKIASDINRNGRPGSVLAGLLPADAQFPARGRAAPRASGSPTARNWWEPCCALPWTPVTPPAWTWRSTTA